MPGVDFFVGPKVADPTAPTVAKFNLTGATATSMDFDQWGYDTETGIDSAAIQIGSGPGGYNLMAPQLILPGTTKVHLSSLKLPEHYFLTLNYTNGIGVVSRGLRSAQDALADAYATDAAPSTTHVSTSLQLKAGNAGANSVAYISVDLANIGASISDAKLTLTGGSNGSPVLVGVYATSTKKWTESGLTWNDAPTVNGGAVDEQSVTIKGTYSWNIASILQAAKKAGLTSATIAIKCDVPSTTGATFASRRSRIGAPLVTVTSHD